MLEKFLQLLSIHCRHKNTTQPFAAASASSMTARGEWEPIGAASTGHYIVCLDCGKKIPYDWANMRRIG